MKQHCVIEGELCSDCCKVLTIKQTKGVIYTLGYVRRWGYPDDWKEGNKAFHMLRKISKRRAKKLNPHLVKRVKNDQAYFKCKNYRDSKCQVYETRPDMCSQYPFYDSCGEQNWKKYLEDRPNIIGLYRPDCTYYNKEFF